MQPSASLKNRAWPSQDQDQSFVSYAVIYKPMKAIQKYL